MRLLLPTLVSLACITSALSAQATQENQTLDFATKGATVNTTQPIPTENVIVHHVTFHYSDNQKSIDLFNLGTPYANTTIISNLIAGVMYGHLLHEKHPTLEFNKDYLYGSILGQLLQEGGLGDEVINTEFNPDAATQAINNPSKKTSYLTSGQGGPYQINDYAKRLPDNNPNDGSLGLINYDAVRTTLGYSINDQDNLIQTNKTGPDALDDIYFGPMATAFYHFNDLNRMQTLASNSWYKYQAKWLQCFNNINDPSLANTNGDRLTDVVMNVVYNAGSYSTPLESYLDVCDSENTNALAHLNDYNLDPMDYRDAIGSKDKDRGKDTYYRYTRQVSFYADQLYGKDLSPYNLKVTNDIQFTLDNIRSVFIKVMDQLSYKDPASGELQLITQSQAKTAFAQAQKALIDTEVNKFQINNKASRQQMFTLINESISNLEKSTGSPFSRVTVRGDFTPTPYDGSAPYKAGDYVYVGDKSNVYQCIVSEWCSDSQHSYGGIYALPDGSSWDVAWVKLPKPEASSF
ncbi:chitin-binding protein [Dongshaea marina]|uniref:chitin-binding protein n=1 Tax=Dongshaea marina TaxID=2047966 RepID=UPI000D3E136A|nr:chitin-binding protein [Dongshaea marina]